MGLRATRPSEVVPVIKEALKSNQPTVMDFIVNPLEMVSPMVPAGAVLSEILELEGCEALNSGMTRNPFINEAEQGEEIAEPEGCA